MTNMSGAVSFFELGVADAQKGRAFYAGLFGWEFAPGPSGNGWMLRTPGGPGGMHAGDPEAVPYVFFAVDDMDAALERVKALGGEVVPSDHGGDTVSGRFAFCKDDQGSHFGLHEPPTS